MNIFVTVGTTSFDRLIENIDVLANQLNELIITFQIANGEYKPKNGSYFEFTHDIDCYYTNADIIITHAGAGSIYRLLELNKKIIVVPNMERVDKHQIDIAKYMADNNHVLLLSDFKQTYDLLVNVGNFKPNPFVKKSFFVKDDIVDFING